jgi:hypothetical protein
MVNSRIKIFLLCPVPEEQKPINEYIALKNNNIVNSVTNINKIKKFNKNIVVISIFTFLILFIYLKIPKSFSSFFANFLIIFNILLIVLIILFFTWNQLQKRFNKARLFYEEASWYDGQLWEKPLLIIKNDRFLSTQQMNPFLEKIFKNILSLIIVNIGFLLFFLLK